MRITFELPDRIKALHGCAIYDDGTETLNLKMATWDMPTDGLKDGMIVKIPSGERLDIVEECDPAVDGSLGDWTRGEQE